MAASRRQQTATFPGAISTNSGAARCKWTPSSSSSPAGTNGVGGRATARCVAESRGESSRHTERVKGGPGDDYYYQMVANIRRYKGVRPLPPVKSQPITIDGHFDDWAAVEPEYRDTIGDPVKRDHAGWAQGQRYVNR